MEPCRVHAMLRWEGGPVISSDLEIFVGQWTWRRASPVKRRAGLRLGSPAAGGGAGPAARSVFEWILDGRYMVQRTQVYDSCGETRLYAMTFTGRVWTLVRGSSDFSTLDFAQRLTGTFSADGNRIDGAWEKALPGSGLGTGLRAELCEDR